MSGFLAFLHLVIVGNWTSPVGQWRLREMTILPGKFVHLSHAGPWVLGAEFHFSGLELSCG